MSFQSQHRAILVSALLLALAGCGQKGPLYLPTSATAAERATLPQTLWGGSAQAAAPATPASAASAADTSAPPAPLRPDLPEIE